MIRTQIYLTPEQHAALRRAAETEAISVSELIRRIVDHHFPARRGRLELDREAALSLVGLGESGESSISSEHDAVLDEPYSTRR